MIHMWAFLDLPDRDRIYYRDGEKLSREAVFNWVKSAAKLNECELLLFDCELYRYDSGQGKFIRTNWVNIEWESD